LWPRGYSLIRPRGLSWVSVIRPVKSYSLTFVADGASTAASFDLSLLPVAEDFKGAGALSVLNPAITNLGIITFTTTIVGTIVTFTFSAAPPELDNTNNLILYVATFLLAFGE
jgi:hypothetical protein